MADYFVEVPKRIAALGVIIKDIKSELGGLGGQLQADAQKTTQAVNDFVGGQTAYLAEQDKALQTVRENVTKTVAKIREAVAAAQVLASQTLAFDSDDPNFVGDANLFGDSKGLTQRAAKDAELIGATYKAVFEDVQAVSTNAFDNMFDEIDQGLAASAKAFVGTWLNALKDIIASRLATQFAELLLGSTSTPDGKAQGAVGFINKLFKKNGTTGFRNGGDFRVGGSGGADSQRVSFLATPNERVSIKTPAQQKADGNGGVSINQVLNVDGGVSPAQFEQAMLRQKKATIAEMQQLKSQGRF